MAKILFPTDFSPSATQAFRYALELADKIGAEIVTLNVFVQPNIPGLERFPSTAEEIYESLRLEAFDEYKESVKTLHEELKKLGKTGLRVRHEFVSGGIVSAICRKAEEEKVDFIVMGTKGATGLREIFLGSQAQSVMAQSSVPVLAVPQEAQFSDISKIMVTTELDGDDSLILASSAFSKLFDARLCVVHVDHDLEKTGTAQKRMSQLRSRVETATLDSMDFHIIPNLDTELALTNYAHDEGVDVIVLVKKNRNFLQRLFHYSISKRIAFHSQVPVLSIPQAEL